MKLTTSHTKPFPGQASAAKFGSALAMVISYTAYKSVLWAIIHGIFSWFYVVYFLLTR